MQSENDKWQQKFEKMQSENAQLNCT
jgi:hypothetical protein